MTGTREQEITRYADQVRQALSDLPPAVRDELLEDLPEHLAEVAAEADGPLADRLGPPEAYATELRTAAGLATTSRRFKLDERAGAVLAEARRRLRASDLRLGPILGYDRASDFLRLLRPAWWLLRAYLATMLISLLWSDPPHGLLPRIDNSELGGALLLVGAVLASIWLGRRPGPLPRWPKLAVALGNAAAVLFGLILLFDIDDQVRRGYFEYGYQPAFGGQYSHVQDVYVYDQQGRLLEGVRLFDQNGEPIRLGGPWCPESDVFGQDGGSHIYPREGADTVWQPYPYCPQRAPFRFAEPTPVPSVSRALSVDPSPSVSPAPSPDPAEPAGP